MSKVLFKTPETVDPATEPKTLLERRNFLRYTGLGLAAGGLMLAGCSKELDNVTAAPNASGSASAADGTMVDVGSGDLGILNYAYALEQLEAAFYAMVLEGKYYKETSAPARVMLRDIAAHERIHRDFLKKAIMATGGMPIKDLEPDFSSIDFNTKEGVLGAAKAFEDLGVSAYNGAGPLIESPDYLTIAGKIVSVEARHAAIIRDFLDYNSFVGPDVVDPKNSLEISRMPAEVAPMANMFLKPGSKISVMNLPTS